MALAVVEGAFPKPLRREPMVCGRRSWRAEPSVSGTKDAPVWRIVRRDRIEARHRPLQRSSTRSRRRDVVGRQCRDQHLLDIDKDHVAVHLTVSLRCVMNLRSNRGFAKWIHAARQAASPTSDIQSRAPVIGCANTPISPPSTVDHKYLRIGRSTEQTG